MQGAVLGTAREAKTVITDFELKKHTIPVGKIRHA